MFPGLLIFKDYKFIAPHKKEIEKELNIFCYQQNGVYFNRLLCRISQAKSLYKKNQKHSSKHF